MILLDEDKQGSFGYLVPSTPDKSKLHTYPTVRLLDVQASKTLDIKTTTGHWTYHKFKVVTINVWNPPVIIVGKKTRKPVLFDTFEFYLDSNTLPSLNNLPPMVVARLQTIQQRYDKQQTSATTVATTTK